MRKISLIAAGLLGLGACGGEPPPPNVEAETGALKLDGPSLVKIAALVTQTNLDADEDNAPATVDPDLVNAWGLAFSGNGIAWISSNALGLADLFNSAGVPQALEVTIPTPKNMTPPANPTGVVFNPGGVGFRGDVFIFATENGTICGWQPGDGNTAIQQADSTKKGAVYKGLALATDHGVTRLYATDFHNARVDVFDDNYHPIHLSEELFDDDALPPMFAPFNIISHNGLLFVTYAKQKPDRHDDDAAPGRGFVDVYTPGGIFVSRFASRGTMNSPWGMAFMPASNFPDNEERMLVGNFGDGFINVFEVELAKHIIPFGQFEGLVGDKPHHPLVIDGLWALVFGPNAGGFSSSDLFFTAGPEDESHGLFGKLTFNK
jgi:uncharacterized protein (TIGR03118 family)